MPTTTFTIASVPDDLWFLLRSGSTYPPTGAVSTFQNSGMEVRRELFTGPTYRTFNGLSRWDTSSIPDNATIYSAKLRAATQTGAETGNPDSRNLVGEYYSWFGNVAGSHADSAPGSPIFSTSLTNLLIAGGSVDIPLTDLSGISTSGYTQMRFHVDGAQPTGRNSVYMDTVDLIVSYTLGPILRSSSSAGTALGVAASTLVIPKPSGLQVGDTMTMRVACSGGTGATITPPTATGTWTLISNGRTNSTTALALAIYQKTAVQADVDATSYTVTLDSNRKAAGSIAAHYNTTGLGQSSGQANASGTTVTAPTVTTVGNNELLLFTAAIDSLSTFNPPSGMTERVDRLGHTPSGAAAIRTYYFGNTTTDGYKNFLEAGSAAPTAGFMTTNPTGWLVTTTAAGNSSQFAPDVERAVSTFSSNTTTPKPPADLDTTLKDAFRWPSKLTGRIASGNWDIAWLVRAQTSASAQAGRMLFRVWAAKNADGSNRREITSGVQVCSTTAALTTTADATTSLNTWNPGAVDLEDEYIFIQAAWEITTAGAGGSGNTTRDVNLRVGSGARVITPSFQPAVSLAHEVADEERATAGATGTRAATATVAGVNIGHSLSLLPSAAGDTVALTGVSSDETVGALTTVAGAVTVSLTGVSSDETVGALTTVAGAVTVSLTGVSSDETVGTLSTGGDEFVTLTGVVSDESVGTLTVVPGTVTISLIGVASDETVGTLTAVPGAATASLTGVASDESVGILTPVAPGAIALTGVPSDEIPVEGAVVLLVPSDTLVPSDILTPSSSDVFYGLIAIPGPASLALTGVASDESVGTLTPAPGALTVALTGVASDETVGALTPVQEGATVTLTGVGSDESVGTLTAVPGIATLALSGLSSEESVGTVTPVPGVVTVTLTGLSSEESVGALSAVPVAVSVALTGLSSEESVGTLTAVAGVATRTLTGLASEESLGTLTPVAGTATISLTGLSSEEAVGTLSASGAGIVGLSGVASEESVGTLTPVAGAVTAALTGLSSEESVGTLTVVQLGGTVGLAGLSSEETVGTLSAVPGLRTLSLVGLASEESVGLLVPVGPPVTLTLIGLASEEAVGILSIIFVGEYVGRPHFELTNERKIGITVSVRKKPQVQLFSRDKPQPEIEVRRKPQPVVAVREKAEFTLSSF